MAGKKKKNNKNEKPSDSGTSSSQPKAAPAAKSSAMPLDDFPQLSISGSRKNQQKELPASGQQEKDLQKGKGTESKSQPQKSSTGTKPRTTAPGLAQPSTSFSGPQPSTSGYQQQTTARKDQSDSKTVATTTTPALICKYKGVGTKGKKDRRGIVLKYNIETNFLPLGIKMLTKVAYHYDVTITPDTPKRNLKKVFAQFCEQNSVCLCFDGMKNAYAPNHLKLVNINDLVHFVDPETGNTREYTVAVQEAENSAIPLHWLDNYENIPQHKIPARALQCLGTVLQSPFQNMDGVQVCTSFFRRPHDRPNDLGDYFVLWPGFFQSIVLGRVPFLNVDVAHKAFPKRYDDMLDLINDVHNTLRMRFNAHLPLEHRVMDALNTHLRGMNICYHMPGNAGRKIYRFDQLDAEPAGCMFTDQEGNRTSVQQYFRSRGHQIQYPNLPCIRLGNAIRHISVPIEFCSLSDAQAINRKTTPRQTSAIIKFAATSTDERKQKILNLLNEINHSQDPAVREFGLNVGGNFTKVSARILEPPQIKYHTKTITPFKGVWKGEGMRFLQSVNGQNGITWGVLNADNWTDFKNTLNILYRTILELSGPAGMQLTQSPMFAKDSRPQAIEENLKVEFMKMKQKGISIIFVIVPPPQRNLDIYAKVKQVAEIQCGVLTQCIKSNTVLYKSADKSTISNILLKVNTKLNGTNHCLQLTDQIEDKALVNNKKCMEMSHCMVIGADVTHPSPGDEAIPSVIGVTASFDQFAFRYKSSWRLQKPKKEVMDIQEFQVIIEEQLKFYKKENKSLPTKLIYYRDGVSEGQFQQVLATEKRAMSNACRIVGGEQYQKSVKLTIIVVQKRHHTRLFPGESGIGYEDRKNNNVPAGTIVDGTITYPNENYFILVSHQSIQGVARPTKYCVLYDDSNFSIDDIQGFTYNLCHLFARCTRSVSYPAPTYYAHLAAARGRVYTKGKRIDLDNLEQQWNKLAVQSEITDGHPMYFV